MIGPRCTHCKKQRSWHHERTNACPVGKLSLEQFHESNTFQAREKSTGGASEKRKNRKVRREVKAEPCVACGGGHCDPCHIRGWKVSQCDDAFNLLPMCRLHHDEQHRTNWGYMAIAYAGVARALRERGWEFFKNPNTGELVLFNEKEVELNRKRRAV